MRADRSPPKQSNNELVNLVEVEQVARMRSELVAGSSSRLALLGAATRETQRSKHPDLTATFASTRARLLRKRELANQKCLPPGLSLATSGPNLQLVVVALLLLLLPLAPQLSAAEFVRPEASGQQVEWAAKTSITDQHEPDVPMEAAANGSSQRIHERSVNAQSQPAFDEFGSTVWHFGGDSRKAPQFGLEPAALVEYSNSSGSVISCRPQQVAGSGGGSAEQQPSGFNNLDAARSAIRSAADQRQQQPASKRSPGGRFMDAPIAITWHRISQQRADQATEQAADQAFSGPQPKRPQVRQDGALVISPFKASQYRPDIHSATYRCCLANQFGALCSRPVRTRAVIESHFNLEVFDEFIFAGNSAALKCRSPAHLAGQLDFIGWLRDERLITGPEVFKAGSTWTLNSEQQARNRKRTMITLDQYNSATTELQQQQQQQQQNQQQQQLGAATTRAANTKLAADYKYLFLTNGDLYIRNASKADAASYKCRARNRLTGETVTSRLGGQLVVEEARARSQLRLIGQAESTVWARENTDTLICAQIQSSPATKFTWFKVPIESAVAEQDDSATNAHNRQQQLVGDENDENHSTLSGIRQFEACLLIKQVQLQHSADYVCEAHDGDSTLKSRTRLLISSAQLSAQIHLQVVQASSHFMNTNNINQHRLSSSTQTSSSWILPSAGQQVVPLGSTVHLNCSISGFPYDTVSWFKDTKLIAVSSLHYQNQSLPFVDGQTQPSSSSSSSSSSSNNNNNDKNNIRLVHATVIRIDSFALKDRGVYQCQVYSARALSQTSSPSSSSSSSSSPDDNGSKTTSKLKATNNDKLVDHNSMTPNYDDERDHLRSASSSVQLELTFVRPVITQKFQNLTVQRGSQISLQCAASGLPMPRIMWFLDNQLINPPMIHQTQSSSIKHLYSSSSSDNDNVDLSLANNNNRYFLTGTPGLINGDVGSASYIEQLDVSQVGQPQSSSNSEQLVFNEADKNHHDDDHDDDDDVEPLMATFLSSQQVQQQASIRDERFQVSWRPLTSTQIGQVSTTIVSQLNISQAQVTETGQYRCVAFNLAGGVQSEALISVHHHSVDNRLELRTYQANNVTLVAGRSATLQCPLIGHPLSRVDWFRDNHRLPSNHRQRVEPIKLGYGGQLVLSNLDKQTDAGLYTCRPVVLAPPASRLLNSSGETLQPLPPPPPPPQDDYDYSDLVGQVRAEIRVAPLIDSQSLPEVVQANEGVRVKLVCSLSQGDHPVEIRWLKRSNDRNKVTLIGGTRLNGFELMRNSQNQNQNQNQDDPNQTILEDSISIHNLEDSCLLTFKQIAYTDSADYLCLAANEVSQSMRLTRVIVNVAPTWSIEPVQQVSVLLSSRLQLDCTAHGFPTPIVSWKRNEPAAETTRISSSNSGHQDRPLLDQAKQSSEFIKIVSNYRQRSHINGSLVIDQVEQADGGLYMCEVNNGVGSGLSKVVAVSVNVPPYFRHRMATQLSQLEAKVELNCIVYGDQPMVVNWRKEGQTELVELANGSRHRLVINEHKPPTINHHPQLSSTESVLTIDNLTRNDSGQYVCLASNEFGLEEMRIQLVVQEPPEAPALMRPIRSGSRQATLSFRPPYSGNSPIRKYAVSFKLLDWLSGSSNNNSSMVRSNANDLSAKEQQVNWQQVLLDAPPPISDAAPPQPLVLGIPLNDTSHLDKLTVMNNQNNIIMSARQQLVNLNLCCLQPFTRYAVRIKAINDIGQSELSKLVQFITDEEAIGGPPLDVGVEATGAHSLKVRWRAPAKSLQNGLIRGYYIGYRANPTTSSASAVAGATSNAISLAAQSAINPNVKIYETLNGAEGEQYQYKNVQLDSSPLNSFRQTIQVPFFANQEVNGGLNLLDLSLQQQQQSLLNNTLQVFTSYLTNLRRKTAYSIIVQAYNKIGAGPRSDQILVSTLDAAPPMSPVLRLLSSSYNSAQLIWSARRFNQATPDPAASAIKGTSTTGAGDTTAPTENGNALFRINELEQQQLEEEDDDPQSYYTINYRTEERTGGGSTSTIGDAEWQQRRLQKRQSMPFVLNQLRCGSPHAAFMTATNSLGQSEPGEMIKFVTMGAAPFAPLSSREFLQINSTFLVLKLNAWQNAGCLISSFIIKIKLLNQVKWTILEHQVHPTIRTVTISGSAVFSTRASASSAERDLEDELINNSTSTNKMVEARAESLYSASGLAESSQLRVASHAKHDLQLVNKLQNINDFVLRNLIPHSNYKLIVEANSEAGTTVAEYELETGNFTSTTIAINVNGISASDLINSRGSLHASTGRGGGGGPNDPPSLVDFGGETDHFSGYSGGQRASSGVFGFGFGGTSLHKYSFGLWSMTGLVVVASIIMALTALILGFRSLIRMKSLPDNKRRSNESLISTMLCCHLNSTSSSSSSAASNADSSHSSSGGTCYQVASDSNYCPSLQGGLMFNNNNNNNNNGASTRVRLGAAATISGNMLNLNACDGGELKSIIGAGNHHGAITDEDELNGMIPFRQLVTSSSLSTIDGHHHHHPASSRFNSAINGRNTYTLASVGHCQAAANRRFSGDEQEAAQAGVMAYNSIPNSAAAAQNNIRSHYAATLGKQNSHHQHHHNFLQNSHQSMKAYNSSADHGSSSPLYGRLQPAKMLNHHNGAAGNDMDLVQTALYVANNQLGSYHSSQQQHPQVQQQHQRQQQQHHQQAISSSGTSGYGTTSNSIGNNKIHLDNECELGIYLPVNNMEQDAAYYHQMNMFSNDGLVESGNLFSEPANNQQAAGVESYESAQEGDILNCEQQNQGQFNCSLTSTDGSGKVAFFGNNRQIDQQQQQSLDMNAGLISAYGILFGNQDHTAQQRTGFNLIKQAECSPNFDRDLRDPSEGPESSGQHLLTSSENN